MRKLSTTTPWRLSIARNATRRGRNGQHFCIPCDTHDYALDNSSRRLVLFPIMYTFAHRTFACPHLRKRPSASLLVVIVR